MIKYLPIVLLLITLCGCVYSDEYQLVYEPSEGVVFAEDMIDTSRISVRIIATDTSGSSSGFVTNKIRSKGPYILDFTIRDFEKPRKELIIHSALIKTTSQDEFNLLSGNSDLKMPFKKSINGEVISWNVSHIFEDKPFQPTFSEDQKLNVFLDISVVSDNNITREKLNIVFNSKISKFKGLLPLSAKYSH